MANNSIKAIDALEEAHKIAFAPFVFQAVVSLRKLGVFDKIFQHRKKGGISLEAIAEELSLSAYGVGVLLEIAESSDIVERNELGNYEVTTTGYFLTYNETVNVNINFTQDVCYKGLFHLDEAIKTGKPEGLKELGSWSTIYEGLSKLTPQQQKAWFEFDHHYSDDIFSEALEMLFSKERKHIFDIGANTGKFSIRCSKFNNDVKVTMIDLPGQLAKAMANAEDAGVQNRVSAYEIDWLSKDPKIPTGADTIWLCQFLDCFSKSEIENILSICANAMDKNAELIIVETFTDRQRFDNAKFILEATSLYFTVLANGNSKMYQAKELLEVVDNAGLVVKEDKPLGEYHTMLVCQKK
ncbi:class I SAM-dependent methyltransferase [Mangrovimonas sp. DI 80]|uniref:class I SAM-dependent methyltransferase n=1 Tax=Mangrovimonas sp. DI 80 TaxID=1779330 RepID=UPI0009781EDB|nr:class I SAM-dependent methyltransferase [Mangrovimonas sp. DI 80]OMP31445.1 SAM-dependent methyltransferase [Mangrovimonas sp. DI 80]